MIFIFYKSTVKETKKLKFISKTFLINEKLFHLILSIQQIFPILYNHVFIFIYYYFYSQLQQRIIWPSLGTILNGTTNEHYSIDTAGFLRRWFLIRISWAFAYTHFCYFKITRGIRTIAIILFIVTRTTKIIFINVKIFFVLCIRYLYSTDTHIFLNEVFASYFLFVWFRF